MNYFTANPVQLVIISAVFSLLSFLNNEIISSFICSSLFTDIQPIIWRITSITPLILCRFASEMGTDGVLLIPLANDKLYTQAPCAQVLRITRIVSM